MFSDQQWVYQDMKDMEEQPRVRRYIISGRQLIGLFTSRRTDNDCLEITECTLPEGYRVRAMTTMSCPSGLILYIEHPSFDPVPLEQDPPTFQQMYELVTLRKTDQEVPPHDAYTIIDVRSQVSEPAQSSPITKDNVSAALKKYCRLADLNAVQAKPTITKDKISAALKKLGVWSIGSRSDPSRWSITDLATDLEAELNNPE